MVVNKECTVMGTANIIVCIDNSDCGDIKLTFGNFYGIIEIIPYNSFGIKESFIIKDDNDKMVVVVANRFLSLKDYREFKINNIFGS